jgi:hypothetical protein
MNFFQIIRSLEDLLYEVMGWLIFYPRTLWRCIMKPGQIMTYTIEELRETTEDRFADLLSPPLFLMLSLLIAHSIERALGLTVEEATEALGEVGRTIVSSEQNLLLYRSFLFALFPLVAAVGLIRRKGVALNRVTLRGPFFQQCYFGGVYGLAISTASALERHSNEGLNLGGIALSIIGTVWYLWVQTRWNRQELGIASGQAAALAFYFFFLAAASGASLGILILRS